MGGWRLLSGVSGAYTGALGVCFLTLLRGLSTRRICTVWSTAPPLLLVQLCHCRHRLNGRCLHSGTGRLEVRQKAASGRACPAVPAEVGCPCSLRAAAWQVSVLLELLSTGSPSPLWLLPLLPQVTLVLTPVWALVSTEHLLLP